MFHLIFIYDKNNNTNKAYKNIKSNNIPKIYINSKGYSRIEEVKENLGLENTQQGKAIGYIDTIKYLNNEITIDELIEKMSKDTRHYAKRQLTYFRNKLDVKWVSTNWEQIKNFF